MRELCQLVNESKIVGRHIVFLYAIKDDVFVDEARTKFFDYISTVIPVINSSNSKAKLKEALKDRGFDDNEIPDEDLSEIAFFIQDMRILTNIANEYSQYRCKLYNHDKNYLSRTKLLAMIVYKNYFPKDYAQLHKRDGLVYSCLTSKNKFIDEAFGNTFGNQSHFPFFGFSSFPLSVSCFGAFLTAVNTVKRLDNECFPTEFTFPFNLDS